MIDKYPKFLPQWTQALENLHNQKERYALFFEKDKKYDDPDEVVRLVKDNTNHVLDWGDGEKCFTGEAFFFTHAPTCRCSECHTMTFARLNSALSLEKFYTYKVKLAEHLRENHKDIWTLWVARF